MIEHAVNLLKSQGRTVTRSDFPPEPLPGLYIVDGQELTEGQVVGLASDVENLRKRRAGSAK